MSETSILLELIKQGGFAVVAAFALWFAIKKDRQVTSLGETKDTLIALIVKEKDGQISKLYDRLDAKSEKHTSQYLKLSKELSETVSALTEAFETEE